MAEHIDCSSTWTSLIAAIGQDERGLGNLILPYGTYVCGALQGLKNVSKEGEVLTSNDIKEAFYVLKEEISKLRKSAKQLEKEKGEEENEKGKFKNLYTKNKQENETLKAQNYQQGVGLGVGIPAAGAAGAGAVVGFPLMAKLLKNVFTRG